MQFLSLLVIVELIIGLTVAQAPQRHNPKNHSYRATILLADDTAPPPADTPPDVPTDNSTDAPADAPADVPTDASGDIPADNGADNGVTNPQDEPSQDSTGTENQPVENQTNENTPPESVPEEQNVNNPPEEFSTTESAVLTDVGTYTNPDNIDQTYVDKAQSEDNQLAQTETPAEAVPLLIDFASNKVDDIGTLIENNDFTSANFTLQRLNEQVDQALSDIGSLDSREGASLKQELIKFSEQADSVFRWQQLIVPEKLEQDFEISRGQFLNIEQIK